MSPKEGTPTEDVSKRLRQGLLFNTQINQEPIWNRLSEEKGEHFTYEFVRRGFRIIDMKDYQGEIMPDFPFGDEIYKDMLELADQTTGGIGETDIYYQDVEEARLPLELLFAVRSQLEKTKRMQGYSQKAKFIDGFIDYLAQELHEHLEPTDEEWLEGQVVEIG